MLSRLIEEELVPRNAQCNSFHRIPNISYVAICDFVNATASCQPDDGFINYLDFIYCTLSNTSRADLWPLLLCLVILWLIFLLNGLSLVADDFLCPTLTAIHRQLGLSENLVGVTFVAFGNGAPDIFGALAALGGDRPEPGLAFGALFGAGIFVTTVVVGAIALVKPFHPMERPLLRDVIFYIITVAWAFAILYRSKAEIQDAVGFIVLYVIYAAVVVIGRKINLYLRRQRALTNFADSEVSAAGSVSVPASSSAALIDAAQNEGGWETGRDDSHPPAAYPTVTVVARGLVVDGDDERGEVDEDAPLLHPDNSPSDSPSINGVPRPVADIGGDDDDDYDNNNDDDVAILSISCTPTHVRNVNVADDDLVIQLTPSSSVATTIISDAFFVPFMGIRQLSGLPPATWKEMSVVEKCYGVVSSPLRLAFSLTVPLAEYNDQDRQLKGWNKPLLAAHLLVLPCFVVSALGYAADPVAGGPVPVAAIALIFGFVVTVVFLALTDTENASPWFNGVPYLGFLVSVLWIYLLAEEIVGILRAIGIVADVETAVLGLTVLAWGNSIGDLITDVALAKAGNSRMALSACFAAPLFNTLLGFGIPFTIAIIQNKEDFCFSRTDINAILVATLTLSLLLTLVWMVSSNFAVGRAYGYTLVALYIAFLTLSTLNLFNVVNFRFSVIIGG